MRVEVIGSEEERKMMVDLITRFFDGVEIIETRRKTRMYIDLEYKGEVIENDKKK